MDELIGQDDKTGQSQPRGLLVGIVQPVVACDET